MPIFGQPFPGGGFQIHSPGFSFPEPEPAAPPPIDWGGAPGEPPPPLPPPAPAQGEPVQVPLGPRFAAAAAGAVAPAAGAPAAMAVPPPAGGSVVWISEAWLAPRPVAYGCPDFAGFYCPPRRAGAAYEEIPPEALEDQAARIETPVAAKIATVGGLGGLLVVGLAAAGAFGR